MELSMTNGFCELSHDEMEMVDGGGWGQFFKALGGTLAIAASPIALACGALEGMDAVYDGWNE